DTAAALKGKYDALVVLAYLPQGELEMLMSLLPEADAVIGGPTGQAISPRLLGPTMFGAATNKGKFLVQLKIPAAKQAEWSGQSAEMSATIPDDSAQRGNVDRYLDTLAMRDFSAADTSFARALPASMPADYRIAGSESCLACHRGDHEKWSQS